MKKLINDPAQFVRESLEGMALAYPELIKVHFEPHFIYRVEPLKPNKVALISGGGSGHEPLHGSFVGLGMLDAACPGEVFTSPTPDQMLEAAKMVSTGAGVLNIVKNYSGDVMNFEMATELAREEGIRIINILIDDDVAIEDSLYTQGHRGVGTAVLAEKIVGAAAEQGYDLKQLADLTRRVNLNGRSMGVALTSCTPPAKGSPLFQLGEDEIEFGVGIHGEPGRQRLPMSSADKITEMLTLAILEDKEFTRKQIEWDEKKEDWLEFEVTDHPLKKGDRVLAFVNSLGGTPLSELYIVFRKLAQICSQKEITIVRSLVGPYITSLEMQGASITLLKLDEELIQLWDAPVKTPAMRWGI